MRPLEHMPAEVSRQIDTVFSDIDDTLTSNGRISERAFSAVWQAHQAGLRVVLITGRPAGWCDHLARMWPVDGVIGENGALAFGLRDGQMQRLYAARPAHAKERLAQLREQIVAEVPGCKVAADQPFRTFDLGIDISEEVPALANKEVDRIVKIFEQHGAVAKVSSIHVNGWFGEFDKLTMCKRWCAEFWGQPLDTSRATFVGDSPNDEPMFGHFPHGCGVANVQQFVHRMKSLPSYITPSTGGDGFAELISHLLSGRQSEPNS